MNRKAFIPISALLGALLLALVAAMTPFVAGPNIAQAQALDANANLSALVIDGSPSAGGTNLLTPGLDTTNNLRTSYTARIGFNDTGVSVTPTVAGTNATVKVNGTTVDGTGSGDDATHIVTGLRAGALNNVNIVVTAEAGNSKTYTVQVYREREIESNNANLSSLSLSGVTLTPGFSSGRQTYNARTKRNTVTVSYSLSDNAGGASAAITAPADACADENAISCTDGMTVRLGAETSSTAITVTVDAEAHEAGTPVQREYTITVYHIRENESTNADLTAFPTFAGLGGAGASPTTSFSFTPTTFAAGTTVYQGTVNNDTSHVTVTIPAAIRDVGATTAISPNDALADDADINNDDTADGEGHQVALTVGARKAITVTVTPEDPGAPSKSYTFRLYRQRDPIRTDATLSSLVVTPGTPLNPSFTPAGTTYATTVETDVTKVTVAATPTDGAAGVAAITAPAACDATTTTNCTDGMMVRLGNAGSQTAITVTVTAEDESTTQVVTTTVYRKRTAGSADASLSSVTFNPVVTGYTNGAPTMTTHNNLMVDFGTPHVTVTAGATAAANGATYVIMPADQVPDIVTDSTTTGHQVRLTPGQKTLITIRVTAEAGNTRDYTFNIYRKRAQASMDATLSALSLSDGTLSPDFMPDTTTYTSRVGNAVNKVTVSYTLNDDAGGAMVAREPADADAAMDGYQVALEAGMDTEIMLTVTPESGADDNKAYTITVYRGRANLSTDTGLNEFKLVNVSEWRETSPGTIDPPTEWDLLNEDGTVKTARTDLEYRDRAVTVMATAKDAQGALVEISPADSDANMDGHQIVPAQGQETTISVTVTPEDPAADPVTHTATIYRKNVSASNDATLSSLTLSGVTLTPEFASDTMEYTGAASFSTMTTTVSAMANHIGARTGVVIMPVEPAAYMDMEGHQVALTNAGQEYTITVAVTPEAGAGTDDANVKTYTIKVTRAATASDDARLASLSLMDSMGMAVDLMYMDDMGMEMTGFMSDVTDYTAMVGSDVTSVDVSAMAMAGGMVTSGDGMQTLMDGENTITVSVTAEDGTAMMEYTVVVTREVMSDQDRLLRMYDTNNDQMIDAGELNEAIGDYLDGTLSASDMNILIGIYLGG